MMWRSDILSTAIYRGAAVSVQLRDDGVIVVRLDADSPSKGSSYMCTPSYGTKLYTCVPTNPTTDYASIEILGPCNASIVAKSGLKLILFGDIHTPIASVPNHDMNILQFISAADRQHDNLEIFIEDTLFSKKAEFTHQYHTALKLKEHFSGQEHENRHPIPDSDEFLMSSSGATTTLEAVRFFLTPCIQARRGDADPAFAQMCPVRARVHTLDTRQKSFVVFASELGGKEGSKEGREGDESMPTSARLKNVVEIMEMDVDEIDDLNTFALSMLHKDTFCQSDVSQSKYGQITQTLYRAIKCLRKLKGEHNEAYQAVLSWYTDYNTKENLELGQDIKDLENEVAKVPPNLHSLKKYKEAVLTLESRKRRRLSYWIGCNLFDVYAACRMCRYRDAPMIVYVGDVHRRRLTQFFEKYLSSPAIHATQMGSKSIKFKKTDLSGFIP